MVAYSFRPRFIAPIQAGLKRQTIRPEGLKRHARPGETLQLYTGMRTRFCRLVGVAPCMAVRPVGIAFDDEPSCEGVVLDGEYPELEGFAQRDGFASWAELKAFWHEYHRGVREFVGLLIEWGDLHA